MVTMFLYAKQKHSSSLSDSGSKILFYLCGSLKLKMDLLFYLWDFTWLSEFWMSKFVSFIVTAQMLSEGSNTGAFLTAHAQRFTCYWLPIDTCNYFIFDFTCLLNKDNLGMASYSGVSVTARRGRFLSKTFHITEDADSPMDPCEMYIIYILLAHHRG